ncbi:Na+/melibiose symporter [Desulfocicer vacuolatum DSM 3385]|uniref:Na+/melibiose symporter n=1 Tax=Desulfocicer vacuolatum DSM 3385 TaxID=1121400 RepID=A0A1W2DIK6_9BACT|nr:MFS transporter [Desulfocicer vacuolatum]SMC97347.1 Na+/melibiose symporter [Desulfocicer vacuolatum DSM 3385]
MGPGTYFSLFKTNIRFGILYLSVATPVVFFMGGIPVVLQLKGVDPSFIGLFQLVGLPAVIKFLLSPVVDRFFLGRNHYKKWIGLAGLLYAITLYGIGTLSVSDNFYILFFVILFATLLSTFIDIPLNALSIKVFSKHDRIAASGYKTSAYFLSGISGSGMSLLLYNHFGWSCTFSVLSAGVLLSLASLFFIKENDEPLQVHKVSFSTILSFFTQPGIGIWLFILAFYFAFILSVWVFIKPYLITKGLNADDVAIYIGFYGSSVGFVGGMVASRIGKYLTKRRILIYFGYFNMFSILILIFMEQYYFSIFFVIAVITFISIAIALTSTIVFSLIMDYSRGDSKGIDYAVQSSLSSIVRMIFTVAAGFLISSFGYTTMFCIGMIGTALVVYVVYRFYKI